MAVVSALTTIDANAQQPSFFVGELGGVNSAPVGWFADLGHLAVGKVIQPPIGNPNAPSQLPAVAGYWVQRHNYNLERYL